MIYGLLGYMRYVGEFPKIRGTLFWGPYNKDSYYLGYDIWVPYSRKLPYVCITDYLGLR